MARGVDATFIANGGANGVVAAQNRSAARSVWKK